MYCLAPSVPREMKILEVTDTSIQISWWEPARLNGVLQVLGDPKVTANIYCKSRNLPNTGTQNYSTDLR